MEKSDCSKRAVDAAIEYLSYRSRTEKEVRDKLQSAGRFDDAIVSEAIEWLKRRGYVDDEKYALFFAESKSRNKLDGGRKIKLMLMRRGIDSSVAEAAISKLNDSGMVDEYANALKLLEKKLKGGFVSSSQRKKLFDYLARKGYSTSAIIKALDEYCGRAEFNCGAENYEWE